MVFGTNVWSFLTDSWFGRPKSASTDNSWEISLYEIVTTMTGQDTSTHGFGSSGKGLKLQESVMKNFKQNAAKSLMTIVIAPAAASTFKRLARRPIRDANKLLKVSGLQQALKVKV